MSEPAELLRYVRVNVIKNGDCRKMHDGKNAPKIHNAALCTSTNVTESNGVEEGQDNIGTCYGDSGENEQRCAVHKYTC